MAEVRRFEPVEIPEEPSAAERAATVAAASAIGLALKALSQRAIGAIADLFMLATVGSAFVLWFLTPKPDTYQIVSLSLYGLLILAANWIVRSRRP